MAQDIEKTIKNLMAEIAKRKEAIKQAQRPQWQTSGTLSITEGTDVHSRANIFTMTSPKQLMSLFGQLYNLFNEYSIGVTQLEWDEAPKFEWQSYSLEQWKHDFKLRLNQLQVNKRKQELTKLEARLDKVMNVLAPEVKAKIELESIMSELDDTL